MKLKLPLFIFLAFTTLNLIAAPWVELDDFALRNDIQFLADTGIITVPVTTYPLMWNAIMPDIRKADLQPLTDAQKLAVRNIHRHFGFVSRKNNISRIKLYAASSDQRFTSFGSNDFDQGGVSLSQEYLGESLAGKVQFNYRAGLDHDNAINQGNDYNMDGSYLAYKMGNWVLSAGIIDRWWGPGVDSSLIMSSNARPLPALSLTRNSSKAFETPWLSWLGPWTLTTQMAQQESDRVVEKPLIWSSRATIRPFRGLEIGTSWSVQWAGKGQPSSIRDFFDIIFGGVECANGASECDDDLNTNKGNHLAGYDIRWSDTLFNTSYAIYTQVIGEDASPNGLISDKASMYGAELRFITWGQRILTSLEYSDTQVSCRNAEDTYQNCFYEHNIYESGYRYYRRAIGSTYDNDTQAMVLTVLSQLPSGNSWQLKLRKAELNTNSDTSQASDKYPNDPNMGNTVAKVPEDLLQLAGEYRFYALDSRFTAGAIITNSTIANETDNNFDAYVKWEYRF